MIANGSDPAQVKREQKQEAKANAENSFETVAREWHSKQGRWTADHAVRVLGSLEKEVFPVIGAKPIHEITAPEILEAVRKIEKRDALDVASRVLQRVSAAFRYAIQTGSQTHNPASDLVGSLKTRKVTHRAALGRAELPEFLAKLNAYDGQPLTCLALRLVMLTFLRSRELRGAQDDASVGRLPDGLQTGPKVIPPCAR